ncbi:MAG: hypothetical protein LBL21_01645 [Rickettsiales bacterium]|jgi:hypothetical protein|nr:hypothetical protein [Rickettsiales bacterium]
MRIRGEVLLFSAFALAAGAANASTIATEGFVRSGLATKADAASLAAVAVSGSYGDLSGRPAIPDVSGKLDKSGGTMTGALTLSADPSANLQAATKQYVDSQVGSILSALNAINGN